MQNDIKLNIMKKKIIIGILFIIIGSLLNALLINELLSSNCELISSDFSKKEWFSFWTTYTTGILAVIIGYLTIVHANNNSKQAIMQQTGIIIRNRNDMILKEIVSEIKLHNSLFNIVRFTSTILYMDENELQKVQEVVLKNKSEIAERQIQWAMIMNLYLNSESVASIVAEYNKVWNDAVEKLETYTSFELSLFQAIENEKFAIETLRITDDLLNHLKEKIKSDSENEQVLIQISELEKQNLEYTQKKCEARRSINANVKELQTSIAQLTTMQDNVFNASILFLSSLYNFVFIENEMRSNSF